MITTTTTIIIASISALVAAAIPAFILYRTLVRVQDDNEALRYDLESACNDRDTARAEVVALVQVIGDYDHDLRALDAENQQLQTTVQRQGEMLLVREMKKSQRTYSFGVLVAPPKSSIKWN
jgi:Skp family chaperone for outer membrane proteins